MAEVPAVSRGHVQHAVRAEGDAPAVVELGVGDAGEDHLLGLRGVEAEPDHPVVGRGAEVGVDPLVLGVGGGDRDAEQAALTLRRNVRDGDHPRRGRSGTHLGDGGGVAFGDEGAAVRQEGDAPGDLKSGRGDLRASEVEPAGRRARGERLGHDECGGGDGAEGGRDCRGETLGHQGSRSDVGIRLVPHRTRRLGPVQSPCDERGDRLHVTIPPFPHDQRLVRVPRIGTAVRARKISRITKVFRQPLPPTATVCACADPFGPAHAARQRSARQRLSHRGARTGVRWACR